MSNCSFYPEFSTELVCINDTPLYIVSLLIVVVGTEKLLQINFKDNSIFLYSLFICHDVNIVIEHYCFNFFFIAVRDDVLGKPRKECPVFIDYTAQNAMKSVYNTPCVWGVYILNLVLKWVKKQGGVPGI